MDLLRWLRPHRITRRDAELLLDASPTPDRHGGLVDLLAAASAPPRPEELAGERAALAAFRREHRTATPEPAAPTRKVAEKRALPLRRRVLVAALAAVVAVFGGTAYAAGTGSLPDPVQRQFHAAFSGVGVPAPDPVRSASPRSVSPSTPAPSSPGASAARAQLLTLCRTWRENRADPGRPPLRPDEQRALAEAAGGPARIEPFCAALTGTPTPSGPAAPGTPGGPAPTGKPGNPNPGVPPTTPPGKAKDKGHGVGPPG